MCLKSLCNYIHKTQLLKFGSNFKGISLPWEMVGTDQVERRNVTKSKSCHGLIASQSLQTHLGIPTRWDTPPKPTVLTLFVCNLDLTGFPTCSWSWGCGGLQRWWWPWLLQVQEDDSWDYTRYPSWARCHWPSQGKCWPVWSSQRHCDQAGVDLCPQCQACGGACTILEWFYLSMYLSVYFSFFFMDR